MQGLNPRVREELKAAFDEFRRDPFHRFTMKLRRKRAEQLRRSLSDPDAVDLGWFNREIWVLSSGAYLRGRDVSHVLFERMSPEQAAELERALDAGELEAARQLYMAPR